VRWKLLFITSVVAIMISTGLWVAAVVIFFGPARVIEVRDSLWPVTLVIPAIGSLSTGFFVYRHTSRRRKLQAMLSITLALAGTLCVYRIMSRRLPHYLGPAPNDLRPHVVVEY